MNQILLTNNDNYKKKNNRNGKNNGNDIKKIIMFFSVVILVFGVMIIGVYGYKIYKNQNQEEKTIAGPEPIVMEQEENKLKIIAKAEAGINKIIYTWNEDTPKEVEMNGRTKHEEELEIPEGQNTLKIKVIDQNGEVRETSQNFYIEENKEKPKIEIDEEVLRTTGKLKIIASDENNGLKYIAYQWNDEEETKIDAESENQTTIETTIDVKRGQNTLKIRAVNNLDKENTLERSLKGVNKPIIEVTKQGGELYMKMSHDMGFEKIEFSINGTIYKYNEEYSEYDSTKQEIEYKFNLVEGENTVIILAVSTEGTQEIYRGKCNYTAE